MKMKFLFAALILPFIALAQQPDTVGVTGKLDSLVKLSRQFKNKGDFDKAIETSVGATTLALSSFGRESDAYGRTCANHGWLLALVKFDYIGAEKWLLEAKDIQGKVVGKETRSYAQTQFKLACNHYSRGNYDAALTEALESKATMKKVLGADNGEYANCLSILATIHSTMGNFDQAEPLLLEYKNFNKKKHGAESPQYALSLSDFGQLSEDLGKYEQAESFYLESIAIQKKVNSQENSQYGQDLNYLAHLYLKLGRYEQVEPLYLEALEILKKLAGREKVLVITYLGLADYYISMGNYPKATSVTLEGLAFLEKKIGTENVNYPVALSTLSAIYLEIGDYEKSKSFCLASLASKQKSVGKEHFNYGVGLVQLGSICFQEKNFKDAEGYLLEAKSIYEKHPLESSKKTPYLLSLLANVYQQIGNYNECAMLLTQVQKSVNKIDPSYSLVLKQAGNLKWTIGNLDEAVPYFLEASELEKQRFVNAAQHLSENEMASYVRRYSEDLAPSFSFLQAHKHSGAAAYDDALFYKGFLLNTVSQVGKLAQGDSASTEKINALKYHRRRLATEYAKPLADRKHVDELEEKVNTIEKQLARDVAGFGEAVRQVRWPEVQAALQPGEAAIEFVDYQYFDPKPTDSIMYAALLIHPGDAQPQFIPLFEKKELLPLLRGATGGNNFLKINALYAAKPFAAGQRSPYELIWKPLEKALKNAATVYCSPSGLLHYLNLAAISLPDGQPFGDTRHLVLLGSTRTLVIPNPGGPSARNDAYLAGGIRYESDRTALSIASRDAGTRSAEITGGPVFQPDSSATRAGDLHYLPATATEVREIGQMLRTANFSAQVDTGFFASEEAFRSLGIGQPSPRILHLATHGYFFPDPKGQGQGAKGNFGQEPVFKMSEHPMIRSGLLLAGAKQAWLTGKHPEGQEDGILTAYEISQMNLSNTELVVLSACETGLGQVSGNEGVYGLQRAFKIAGVKYLIMSLWKVDDRSTAAFMAKFYQQWLQRKQSIPQAFRTAQQAMRIQSPGAYDWAGFVLIE